MVKPNVLEIVDAAHLDAFLANCDCKHESRNTVLLKVCSNFPPFVRVKLNTSFIYLDLLIQIKICDYLCFQLYSFCSLVMSSFQVVVIFVICVVFVLVTYMLFLMCLDPMLRKQRHSVPYRQQNDEVGI